MATKKETGKSKTVKTNSKTTTKSSKAKNAKAKTSSPMRKQTAKEKKLVEELTKLLPSLDEEGLSFLLEQTSVLLYNMKLEEEVKAENEALKENAGKSKSVKSAPSIQIVRGDNSDIYHIVCNGRFSMMNDDELLSIIKICHTDDELREIVTHLYHWFFIERRDFLNDNGLTIDSIEMEMLVKIVKKQFKIIPPKA
ncbi:MAG: hypothetical protein P1P64_07380 [Treponemataceae bacterium]